MKIKVIAVETTSQNKGKSSWKTAEVTYKDLDKNKTASRKIISFNFPEVFDAISKANAGDELEIQLKKNDESGYWDWVGVGAASVTSSGGDDFAPAAPSKKGASSYGRDFETSLERAKKQVYIVRQSSFTSALDLIKHNSNGEEIDLEAVIFTAKQIEAYVFEDTTSDSLAMMADDLPE